MCGTMFFENTTKEYAEDPENKPKKEAKMRGCITTCSNVDGCNSANVVANNSFASVVTTLIMTFCIRPKLI